MKKIKSYSKRSVLFRTVFFLLISLPLFLFFGCEDEPEEDMSISEITIYNIPANIPVAGGNSSNPAFKIYLNASNSRSESAPPVAKGLAKLSQGTLKDGKYSVKIKLQKPNSASDKDPNTNTGPWSGTASFFSVMISPQSVVTDGIDAVWIKAGMTLNKGKAMCAWEGFMDFRVLGFASESQALYNEIILQDSEIAKPSQP